MKRSAKLLLTKAINSLVMSVDHFNNSSNEGRTEAVLIFLDHSFEMLLKASLVERGAKIREKGAKNTIGFDHCVRKGLTEGDVQFLTEEQALTLQTINNYRDAAQHYLLDISEQLLYMWTQTGVTVFRTILRDVFDKELADYFPERVLPISTVPAVDITEMFHSESEAIRQLMKPGTRKRTEALARLRPLAIMEEALQGQNQTPSDEALRKLGRELREGKEWYEVFPSVAAINVTSKGYGPSLEMHITKKEGIPIHIVPEGTPHAGVLAVKRVNELSYYNMNLTQLREKVGLNQHQCLAVIWHLDLRSDIECYKEFKMGKSSHKRYSHKALDRLKKALPSLDLDEIRKLYGARNKPNE